MKQHFGQKAQGAMEYLMTYGWAILVVMIVGVAMWRLGVFDLGGGASTTIHGFAKIKPVASATGYTKDGVLTIGFLNGIGYPVWINGITMADGKGNSMDCGGGGDISCCQSGLARYADKLGVDGVRMDKNEIIVIVMDPAESGCVGGGSPGGIGESYTMDVTLSYIMILENDQPQQFTSSGRISGKIE
ncbi:MAG TPA: hypothetical protein ENN13_03400 [Candidatus Altiarchaeales archaeon]|nr:hypothetical protein [Candidatus Altiarchaeales archaeon]